MFFNGWEWGGVALAAVVVAVALGRWLIRRRPRGPNLGHARQTFHLRREWLEANFFKLASHSGKPRGLEWLDCDFADDVAFARDRHTGRLRALVAVTIRFGAIAGEGMEDNPNVGNLRAGTAVFLLDADEWTTDGRAIFNLNPTETIAHFREELELVE